MRHIQRVWYVFLWWVLVRRLLERSELKRLRRLYTRMCRHGGDGAMYDLAWVEDELQRTRWGNR